MALNAKQAPRGGKVFPPMDAGSYPARTVQVIDLGIQQQEYKGEAKAPRRALMISYEFLDEFLPDDEGEPDLTKPRWLSEQFPLNNLSSTLAKSTARYYALDPTEQCDGDFTQLLNIPCSVTVVQDIGKDKVVRNKIAGVSAMRPKEAARAAPLVNPTKLFTMDDPDLDIFLSLPNWVQDKIKEGLEYSGSALERLVAEHKGTGSQKTEKSVSKPLKAPVEDEIPFKELEEDEDW